MNLALRMKALARELSLVLLTSGTLLTSSGCSAKAPLLCAHRGSIHHEYPDNSLAAIREAVDAGVPFLEVDVRMSHEGELFLFHDTTLRDENSSAQSSLYGRHPESLSHAERDSITLPDSDDAKIPLLREALSLVAHSHSQLQLDIKRQSPEIVDAIVQEVDKSGDRHSIILQFRNIPLLQEMKARYPNVQMLARCRSMEDVEAALAAGADTIELERWLSTEAIERIHASGKRVLFNVSNSVWDTQPIRWYLGWRDVDIVMTDNAHDGA